METVKKKKKKKLLSNTSNTPSYFSLSQALIGRFSFLDLCVGRIYCTNKTSTFRAIPHLMQVIECYRDVLALLYNQYKSHKGRNGPKYGTLTCML